MNKEEARQLFGPALRDELSSQQLAAFEQALEQHNGLEAEFEAFADTESGGGVKRVTDWLQHTGKQAATVGDNYDDRARKVIERAETRKRGRLIQLVGAISAVAAGVALVAVLAWPGESFTPEQWPETTPGQVSVMYGDSRHFETALENFRPAEGVSLSFDAGTLVRPAEQGARLDKGKVLVRIDEGANYEILVGNRKLSAKGPAEFTVSAEPLRFENTTSNFTENDPMLDSRILSRFGAKGFALSVSLIAGAATLHGAEAPQVLNAPQTMQVETGPPHAPKPPKVEDVFAHLDANDDGKLDGDEVPQKMLNDFDDDGSGDIDVDEFKEHHKPPQHDKKPEDMFADLDINGDGKLDADEVPQKMIDDADGDDSDDLDLDEFKEGHKPPMPPKPKDPFKRFDLNDDGVLDATEVPQHMIDGMDDDNSGDINLDEFRAHPPKHPKPKKPEDVFDDLDTSGDELLDSYEAGDMVDDFDDNDSGDVDLNEFKKHWKPKPPTASESFEKMDRNEDGVLDATDIPKADLDAWDDDGNGSVDETEFEAHYVPPAPPRRPKPPEGGPEGDRPRGPGGDRPRGPGGDGPRPPRPPRD